MAYLVLARKYRPSIFEEMVGQDHVVRTLQNAIKHDRVHHAFLFTGARGVGKTSAARILARAINCAQGPSPTPCGECPSCVELQKGASTDVLEIDGASNTGVDNVREIREAVRYLPQSGRFKIYIIDEVHMLSQAAFNALLKTLEEPPAHVKFIFATTEPHKIPITILSRCQRFDFRRVSRANLTSHLQTILEKEKVTLGPSVVATLVREAQGSVRDCLSLLDQVLSFAGGAPADELAIEALGVIDRQTIFEFAEALVKRDAQRMLALVAEVDARGHELTDVARLLVEHVRDLTVVKTTESVNELVDRSPDEQQQLTKQATECSRADLHRWFRLLVAVAEDVGRSVHPKVSLEMGLLRLLEVAPTQDLEQLMTLVQGGAPGKTSTPSVSSEPAEPTKSSPPATSAKRAREVPPAVTTAAKTTVPTASAGWERLIARVGRDSRALASVLEHATVLEFGPQGVRLGFERGTFYAESATDSDNQKILRAAVEAQFGQPVVCTIDSVEAAQGQSSVAKARQEEQQAEVQRARTAGAQHPAVQEAVAVLGGEVRQVTPLGIQEP